MVLTHMFYSSMIFGGGGTSGSPDPVEGEARGLVNSPSCADGGGSKISDNAQFPRSYIQSGH